jgi:hypothetical protein
MRGAGARMKRPLRSLRSLPPAGHPCEQGEAKARRARLQARVAADATTQRIGHDIAEAALSALRAAGRAPTRNMNETG